MSFRWHPRYVFGLLALPLCGAALTFLCSPKGTSFGARGKEK
jgi:hypothetical protein